MLEIGGGSWALAEQRKGQRVLVRLIRGGTGPDRWEVVNLGKSGDRKKDFEEVVGKWEIERRVLGVKLEELSKVIEGYWGDLPDKMILERFW